MTIKEIHSKLDADECSVSYQAIHKLVQSLIRDCVVERFGKGYRLNPEWIEREKKRYLALSEKYAASTDGDDFKPLCLSFDNYLDFAKYIVNDFFIGFKNPNKKSTFCIERHSYPILGASQREIESIKKIILASPHYGITARNAPLDHLFSDFLVNMGRKSIIGVRLPVPMDTFVQGDYVMQVYFTNAFVIKWDQLFRTEKKLDDRVTVKLFEFATAKTKINVLITKNAKQAEHIRQAALKLLGG